MPTWTVLPDGTRRPLSRYVEHDEASRGYAMDALQLVPSESAPLRSVDHGVGPRLDQGRLGSCTGNEKTNALNTRTIRELMGLDPAAPYLGEVDAVRIYDKATRLDNVPGVHPPSDTGSTGLAACKATIALGYMKGHYRHTFTTRTFLRGLQVLPAGCGTGWTESMSRPDPDGYVAPRRGEDFIGGHQWQVYGFDEAEGDALCQNSWGLRWGLDGLFRMRMEVWEDLVIRRRGDVTFLVPATITTGAAA